MHMLARWCSSDSWVNPQFQSPVNDICHIFVHFSSTYKCAFMTQKNSPQFFTLSQQKDNQPYVWSLKKAIIHYHSILKLNSFLKYLEREEFYVMLNCRICPVSANKTFGIKYSVLWICCKLIFCSISNQPLTIRCECHIGRSNSVSLIICNNFNTPILIHANTGNKKKKFGSYGFVEQKGHINSCWSTM